MKLTQKHSLFSQNARKVQLSQEKIVNGERKRLCFLASIPPLLARGSGRNIPGPRAKQCFRMAFLLESGSSMRTQSRSRDGTGAGAVPSSELKCSQLSSPPLALDLPSRLHLAFPAFWLFPPVPGQRAQLPGEEVGLTPVLPGSNCSFAPG